MKFAFSVTFSAQSCRDPCPYKASWPSCAASDCKYLPSHSRVGVRSGRYCADFDRPRPRAAMASTLPDSTSQLTSHLRQVSWGMIEQNCFERKQILSDCKRSRKCRFAGRSQTSPQTLLSAGPPPGARDVIRPTLAGQGRVSPLSVSGQHRDRFCAPSSSGPGRRPRLHIGLAMCY